jgi:predicted PurR-regulated permease PerM
MTTNVPAGAPTQRGASGAVVEPAAEPALPRSDAPRSQFAGPPAGSPERRSRHVGWRSRDVLRAAVLVGAVYVFARLIWFANALVFVVFLGVLFGLAVARGVDFLERFHLRRGIASALLVFGTLAALGGIGRLTAPTISAQIGELRNRLPESLDKAESWVNSHAGSGMFGILLGRGGGSAPPAAAPAAARVGQPGANAPQGGAQGGAQAGTQRGAPSEVAPPSVLPKAAAPGDSAGSAPDAASTLKARIGSQLTGATRYLFPFLSSTLAVVGGLVLIIFLAIYIGAEPDLYHRGMMHLFPHRARERAGEVMTEMAAVLRKWLVTQLIAMLVIGTVTTIAMLLLGVKAAFALGFIAGLMEFIPTFGPIFAAVPAIAMGFVDSPQKALYVVLAYWAIQFLENNLLIPALMRGGMDLPPALTMVAQALMVLVFGFLGLMVAVPLTAAVLVAVKMLYVEGVVGDPIGVRDDDDDD